MNKKPYSIVLVEDHVIVRAGLKELIEHVGNYKVIAEFDHGGQLVEQIHNINPDLIIMDLTMPVMDGLATMTYLKENSIDYHPVLMLTLETADSAIVDLYKAGIRGYLSKTCTADALKAAIEDILTTGYHNNSILATALMKSHDVKGQEKDLLGKLTDREVEFIKHVCDNEEYTYETIAKNMGVHRRTVDNYRESIFRKLDVKSKTGLVIFAIKYGLIKI